MTEYSYIGQKIDSYTIESIIGRGSVAVVYRALTPTNTVVALKLFSPPPNGEEKLLLARFQREARLAAGLDHPNIVAVLDTGEIDGRAYMVMPFAGGETLDARLRRKLKLSELTSIEIAWQIADALAYAHRQGIIHRDVKLTQFICHGFSPTGNSTSYSVGNTQTFQRYFYRCRYNIDYSAISG